MDSEVTLNGHISSNSTAQFLQTLTNGSDILNGTTFEDTTQSGEAHVPSWSSCPKYKYDKMDKHSLLKRDNAVTRSKIPVKRPQLRRVKQNGNTTEGISNGNVEENEHAQCDSNRERTSNFKIRQFSNTEKEKENLEQKERISNKELLNKDHQIRQLQEQLNNTQKEKETLEEHLKKANQSLQEARILIKVKDGQLKEDEVKWKCKVSAEEQHFTSKDKEMLFERLKNLEEQNKSCTDCQTKQKIKDMFEHHAEKNTQQIKNILEEQVQQCMEQLTTLYTNSEKAIGNRKYRSMSFPIRNTSSTDEKVGILKSIVERNNLCWRNHTNCLMKEKDFQFISDHIGGDWKRMLRSLNVTQCQIESIEAKYERTSENAVQGLTLWHRQAPREASFCTIIETFGDIDRHDIIEKLDCNSSFQTKDVTLKKSVDKIKNQCWRNHNNCLLNEKDFQFVGDRIAMDWKRILRLLDVKGYHIENLEANCEKFSPAENAYQGLILWQRQTPKRAALCTLIETLHSIDHHNIIEALNCNPSNTLKKQICEMKIGCEVTEQEVYIASIDHYVGREEEIQKIKQFCEESQDNHRLLYINGLPGMGKSEVLLKALSQIDRKNICQPNFFDREDRIANWTFQEFLQCVTKSWKLTFKKDVTNILEELFSVREPLMLILEMAMLKADPVVMHKIWRFIYDITRNNQSKLKVMASTCKHPEEVLMHNVPAEQVILRRLDENNAIKLLKKLNPKISDDDGKEMTRFFGGNPFLLLKVSANIKTFFNFEEEMMELRKCINNYSLKYNYVDRLVKGTEWAQKMAEALEGMEENERVVLAKFCVFSGPIPRCLITHIFRDQETKHEAQHLYMYHSILELIRNGSAYFLPPIYRVFMKMYIKKDKNKYTTDSGEETLQSILEDARKVVRKCYVKLLVSLSHMFLSKTFVESDIDICCVKLVKEYRKSCRICSESECVCRNFVISKYIFKKHRRMIIKSLEETLSHERGDFMLLSPVNIFVFLAYMSEQHSLRFQETLERELFYEDMKRELFYEDCKCVFSCCYRILLKATCEKDSLDLDFLNNSVTVIKEKECKSPSYQSVLFLLYLTRARVKASTEGKSGMAEIDLKNAKEIYLSVNEEVMLNDKPLDISCSGAGCSIKSRIKKFSFGELKNKNDVYSFPTVTRCNGKFAYIGAAADIALKYQKYDQAKNLFEAELKLALDQLGEEHPFTAKSRCQLGKCQENLPSEVVHAADNYKNIYFGIK